MSCLPCARIDFVAGFNPHSIQGFELDQFTEGSPQPFNLKSSSTPNSTPESLFALFAFAVGHVVCQKGGGLYLIPGLMSHLKR